MKAIVANPAVTGALEIGDAPEPNPDSSEALVRVTALSLNRGELRRAQSSAPGTQIGWDLVGVVETAARDGSGPKAGQRVVDRLGKEHDLRIDRAPRIGGGAPSMR